MTEILLAVLGATIGAMVAWLVATRRVKEMTNSDTDSRVRISALEADAAATKSRLTKSEEALEAANRDVLSLRAKEAELSAKLEAEQKTSTEKLELLDEAKSKLEEAFKALSADALRSNNESFLTLAQTKLGAFQDSAQQDLDTRKKAIDDVVKPLKESLEKVDKSVKDIEAARVNAYATIEEKISSLSNTEGQLRTETANLVKALRTPQGRGKWGELQLQRLVELAGMVEHCHFEQQVSADTDTGRLRPDLIIYLPNDRQIVVDAKTPLLAYLESLEATDDDVRATKLKDHAQQVRKHMDDLSGKAYWEQFSPTPEIVVMFLEAESIFSAALQGDSSLIEYGAEKRVILATPTTLLSLLRAVHYGWRQEQIAENAQAISNLGKELYARILTLGLHFGKVGSNLRSAVNAYNDAVGSLESRVLSGARKFKELGVSTKDEIKELDQIEATTRNINADELLLNEATEATNPEASSSSSDSDEPTSS